MQNVYDFQAHKIILAKMFVARDSNLRVKRLMLQVFLDLTQCHSANGFQSVKRT
jgi:hypothetical protein